MLKKMPNNQACHNIEPKLDYNLKKKNEEQNILSNVINAVDDDDDDENVDIK